MPGFDGSGPRGMGPRTGGGRGFCSPDAGIANTYRLGVYRGIGRGGVPWGGGRGRAWGGGAGWGGYGPAPAYIAGGYGSPAQPDPQQELGFLKNQAAAMEQDLDWIRQRIEELQAAKKED